MNFDHSLRSAMPAQIEPECLDSIIASKVAQYSRRRIVRRRVSLTFAATATAITAVALYPAISAQAALMRIAGALDGVQQMVARRYNLGPGGERIPAGVIAYDHGKWRVEGGGGELTLFREGHRYRYEPFTKSFIVEPADGPFFQNGDIHLSSIVAQVSAWHNDVDIRDAVVDGRRVTEAIATSRDLPERMTIVADAESKLPFRVLYDAKESQGWRRSSVMEIEYSSSTKDQLFLPDPRIPQLNQEAWRSRVVESMLARKVSEYPIRDGKLVIRALDVAEDGSVFVAFQTGQYRGGWSGYAFTLGDNLGATYTQIQNMSYLDSPFTSLSRKQGGPIEFAVFVPTSVTGWRPRTLTLSAHIGEDGDLERMVEVFVVNPDGTCESRWQPNHFHRGTDGQFQRERVTDKHVAIRSVDAADVDVCPGYMSISNYGDWHTPLTAQLAKARARAEYFKGTGGAAQEASWLREELRLMTEIEAEGGGPYSRKSVEDRLTSLALRGS